MVDDRFCGGLRVCWDGLGGIREIDFCFVLIVLGVGKSYMDRIVLIYRV